MKAKSLINAALELTLHLIRNNAALFENLSFVFIIYNIQAITILSQQESEGALNIFLFCLILTNDRFILIVSVI